MPSYPDCCDFHRETKDMFLLMKCTNRTDGEKEAAQLREQLAAEREAHERDREKWMGDIAKGAKLQEQLAAEQENLKTANEHFSATSKAWAEEKHKREACEVLIRDLQKELASK